MVRYGLGESERWEVKVGCGTLGLKGGGWEVQVRGGVWVLTRVVRFGEADHPRITDGWLGTGILPHDTRLVYGTRGWAQRRPKCCLPPTPRRLRSASAPFRAYRRAIGTIFGLPFFATRPLPDALHLQTPVCKERRVGEGATSVMRRSRKPYLLHVGTRETMPKRSGEASLFE